MSFTLFVCDIHMHEGMLHKSRSKGVEKKLEKSRFNVKKLGK